MNEFRKCEKCDAGMKVSGDKMVCPECGSTKSLKKPAEVTDSLLTEFFDYNNQAYAWHNRKSWVATVEAGGKLHRMPFDDDSEDGAKAQLEKVLSSNAWSQAGARLVDWVEHGPKERERDDFEFPTEDVETASDGQDLTYDHVIDMYQKAKNMPEPERAKALQQLRHISSQFESSAHAVVRVLLDV